MDAGITQTDSAVIIHLLASGRDSEHNPHLAAH